MDIESYAAQVPQYYSADVPVLLSQQLERRAPLDILDCGCGDGSLLYALKMQGWLENKNVFAVDLSRNRINLVRNIDSRIIAKVDGVEDLVTMGDASIDLLISTQVIEHVDDMKMIAAIDRVLRSGGCVYLSTVFKKSWGWYFYRNNGKWVLDPTHLREYQSDEELLRLIDGAKFDVVENQKTLFWFPVADFFIKRLGIQRRTIFEKFPWSWIRAIRVPIPGYYIWELVAIKRSPLRA